MRKTLGYISAAVGILFVLMSLGVLESALSADELLEPQPLEVSPIARGLKDSLYPSETPPADQVGQKLPLDAPVANEASGERPASFEARVPKDQSLVPWTQAPRFQEQDSAEQQTRPAASDLSGQVIKQKQPLPQKDGATLALRRSNGDEKAASPRGGSSGLGTMFASLFLVLGLFFLAVWMIKKGMPKGASLLPSEVVEVLGRAPLGAKQQVHLLRVGNKMLLVAISAGGVETLSEITDPLEVDRLAGLCQQRSPHSSTNAFKHIFQQFGRRGETELLDEPLAAAGTIGNREVRHG